MFEENERYHHWRDVIRGLQVPMPPYRGARLLPGDRCPLIGRGCGSYCRYQIGVTPDVGHYIRYTTPDGRIVERQIETAKGRIDGHCLTKQRALAVR